MVKALKKLFYRLLPHDHSYFQVGEHDILDYSRNVIGKYVTLECFHCGVYKQDKNLDTGIFS